MKILVYDMEPFEEADFSELGQQMGIDLTCVKEPLTLETAALAKGYDGVSILGWSKADRTVLEKLRDLGVKALSTRTIGYDHIDTTAARELGISVSNASYSPHNVADFTIMLLLMLLRNAKVSVCRALVNDFSLDGMQGREVHSLTVGIIGTGKIGRTVIRNLKGFGCRILAYDIYPDAETASMAEYVDLDTLYAQSDVISLHMPLTKDNYHMINRDSISRMKDGVLLINTARGGLVNTEDLIDALEKQKVGGAGIDTLEEEAGVAHIHVGTTIIEKRSLLYLKQFHNVIFTQHYAFFTKEATRSMVYSGLAGIANVLEGKDNPYQVC